MTKFADRYAKYFVKGLKMSMEGFELMDELLHTQQKNGYSAAWLKQQVANRFGLKGARLTRFMNSL